MPVDDFTLSLRFRIGLGFRMGQVSRSQVLLLDAFGTLLFPTQPIAQTYHQAAINHGLSLSQADIELRFPNAFQRWFRHWRTKIPTDRMSPDWLQAWSHDPQATVARWNRTPANQELCRALEGWGDISEADRWKSLIAEVMACPERTPEKVEQIFAELWECFQSAETWKLCSGFQTLRQAFAGTPLQICLASNFDARLHNIVKHFPELDSLHQTFISSELGTCKPSPEFYRRLLNRQQVHAEETIMVGDSWYEDVLVPQSLGMRCYWVQPETQWQQHPQVVANLQELADQLAESLR